MLREVSCPIVFILWLSHYVQEIRIRLQISFIIKHIFFFYFLFLYSLTLFLLLYNSYFLFLFLYICLKKNRKLRAQELLSLIHVFRTHTHYTLLATLNYLQKFIVAHPGVKLVVVDSISACLRHSFTADGGTRIRFIHTVASVLTKLARANKLAV